MGSDYLIDTGFYFGVMKYFEIRGDGCTTLCVISAMNG